MKIIFEKKIWFESKAKLRTLYNFLTEGDFQYMPGKECEVSERIRKILGMTTQDFYKLASLTDKKEIKYN